MFGYVVADPAQLDEDQRRRYRAAYCGLCRALGDQCSQASRLSLTYDMTFLVVLLTSLYEPEETAGESRCPVHPLRPQPWWRSPFTDYGAAMNVLLAHENCLDDWRDDRSLPKLALARLFRGPGRAAAERYPRQAAAVAAGLAELGELERGGVPDPDRAANAFGRLLGEIFVWDPDDHWAGELRTVGEGLGRFVYILDAVLDLPEDTRRGRYNPLSALGAGRAPSAFTDELTMLLGECTAAFERLPLVQDAALLRSVLYAGVWARLRAAEAKKTANETGGDPHGSGSL